MFTGIIERKGKISFFDQNRLRIQTGYTDLTLGESVAINGVCLTVTEEDFDFKTGEATFFLSPETLTKSNLGNLKIGSWVNLERALQAGKRLSGHIVQGHVDGRGEITQILPQAESRILEVAIPAELLRYCVEKGSIAIDGVSLTINRLLNHQRISLTLIPHTWLHTCFSLSSIGDTVNLEVDVLAKYLEKLCQPYQRL